MEDNQEKILFSNSPKRRIHEQDYALKVVSQQKIDKQTVHLNESLFNAKISASQSSNLIKEIFRSVQKKIKKFDDYIKNNESFKKQQNEKSILSQEEVKNKQEILQLQKLSKQQSEEINTMQPTQTNTINQLDQELLQTPKNNKKEMNKIEYSLNNRTGSQFVQKKTIQSVNQKSEQLSKTPQSTYRKNSPQKRATTSHKSFFALSSLKPEINNFDSNRQTARAQTTRTPGIAERNKEWKEQLQKKIEKQQINKQKSELLQCTFKPCIAQQKQNNNYQKCESKEFQSEIKELVQLINGSSKKKSQKCQLKKK